MNRNDQMILKFREVLKETERLEADDLWLYQQIRITPLLHPTRFEFTPKALETGNTATLHASQLNLGNEGEHRISVSSGEATVPIQTKTLSSCGSADYRLTITEQRAWRTTLLAVEPRR